MHIATAKASVPMRTTIDIEASAMVETAVSAIIGTPYARATIVEVAAVVVAVDREEPAAGTPHDRAEEVIGSRQEAVLPVVEYAAQVVQAIAVVVAIDIAWRIDTEEVVKVDFVGIVVLLFVEVQLVCHLVRQVECLCLCAFQTHCTCAHAGGHHKH